MCEQCSAQTTIYVLEKPQSSEDWGEKQEPLPGYILVRATKDGTLMKKGDWGLVVSDDPDFIWSVTPTSDKFWGLSDEELDLLPEHEQTAISIQDEAAFAFGRELLRTLAENQYRMCFETIERLMKACREKGWDGECAMERWLFHYLGSWIEVAKEIKHGD